MSEETAHRVVEFVNQILTDGAFRLTAEGGLDGDLLKVEINGDDIGLLLGRNAELLDALEYVSNRAFVRDLGPDIRMIFDSGNYRARREKELYLMAEKAAEKVRTSRVPFSFDPMSPNDRRIVHLALADDATVTTESQGDGIDRRVKIYPA